MLVCPIDQEVFGLRDSIITFFNLGEALILSTIMGLHLFLNLLDPPLKKLLFRFETTLDVGVLRVNCILNSILLSFGQAVKILAVDVVGPGWALTDLINLSVLHLPKGY